MTIDVVSQVATFLAEKTEKELGEEMFYYQMPSEVDECTVVQRVRTGRTVLAVIDAGQHGLRIACRAATSDRAYELALEMYEALNNREDEITDDQPGFIELEETRAQVVLYDTPQFYEQDQQGRKTFEFYALLTTKN